MLRMLNRFVSIKLFSIEDVNLFDLFPGSLFLCLIILVRAQI